MMLTAATLLFLIGAVFGFLTWLRVMGSRPTSRWLAIVHGLIVVVALVLVSIFAASGTGPVPRGSILLFATAGVIGLILFIRDLSKTPGPRWLAIIHPIFAVIALLLLIAFVVSGSM
jgi:hypothetical protein